jgi:SpoVK/Ycf46/Vps4 family AAA+-type ATPase
MPNQSVSRFKQRQQSIYQHPHATLVGLWCTRILLDLEGLKGLDHWGAGNSYTSSGGVLKAMDIGYLEDKEMNTREFKAVLRQQQQKFQTSACWDKGNLPSNIRQLGQLLHLDDIEQKVLMFAIILHSHQGLDDTADALEQLTSEAVIRVLAVILDLPLKGVRASLDTKGLLQRSGLLRLTRSGSQTLSSKLELADGLSDTLFQHHSDVLSMLEQYFHLASPAGLSAEQFPHVAEDMAVLEPYLTQVLAQRSKGSNILLYGAPGTGKTEFSKMLAERVGARLYEVSNQDEDGDPLGASYRFRAFKLTQEALSHKRNSLILFDEIEDVFPNIGGSFLSLFSPRRHSSDNKGWVNQLLEENPVPAIWVSNDIAQIDPAFIRRFDYALEIPIPPRHVRADVLRQHLRKTRVSSQWIDRIAENRHLSPAIVARAARLTAKTGYLSADQTQACMERIIGNTLKAMGHEGQVTQQKGDQPAYRLDVLNSNCDLQGLLGGLEHQGQGRICLYGPPGTGKTEFGKYIARRLDKPLLVKRASDLLGMFVGQTEKQIAAMFEEARAEDAVLLLDEADSFLRDRKGAHQSWEVTQVNELLTQMENHQGVFICSTNLIEELDAASIRRFDFKIKLDYMELEHVCLMFRQTLKDQGVRFRMTRAWRQRLDGYRNLAPGDFSTVIRQHRFSAQTMSAESLLEGLRRESDFKQDSGSRGIGFTARL